MEEQKDYRQPHSKKSGSWIVITGMDGAGKTTLVKSLSRSLLGKVKRFRLPHHRFVNTLVHTPDINSPTADPLTDRLIFAADSRLTNFKIKRWLQQYDYLVSQRGWEDNFIFGRTQKFSYAQINNFVSTNDLQKPSAVIYLFADPSVAYSRIKTDPGKDKFETQHFMKLLYNQTLNFYNCVKNGTDPTLTPFRSIPTDIIDTTKLTTTSTFLQVKKFLVKNKLAKFST